MPYVTSVERIGFQKGYELGFKLGLKLGYEFGIRKCEGTLLLRLIELRFGTASEAVIRQVREADADTLLLWSERILTAATLSDVMR